MKKIFLTLIFCLSIAPAFSQVFNAPRALEAKTLALGLNPVVYNNDLGLFLRGGLGVKKGLDLNVNIGLLPGGDYYGASLDWYLLGKKSPLSLTTGGHLYGDVGFDMSLNLAIPISKGTSLFTALDTDIYFQNNGFIQAWIPVGVEVGLSKVSLILEGDIPVNSNANSIFGGGIVLYL